MKWHFNDTSFGKVLEISFYEINRYTKPPNYTAFFLDPIDEKDLFWNILAKWDVTKDLIVKKKKNSNKSGFHFEVLGCLT